MIRAVFRVNIFSNFEFLFNFIAGYNLEFNIQKLKMTDMQYCASFSFGFDIEFEFVNIKLEIRDR